MQGIKKSSHSHPQAHRAYTIWKGFYPYIEESEWIIKQVY